MKIAYDFHIHSCLSPCADNTMTPGNIVGMAKLKGLDIIAVSDHQSVGNVQSAMEAAEDYEILVLPAMEVESREEVHLLCLFCSLADAVKVEKTVRAAMPNILNNPGIFGEQLYMDKDEGVLSSEPALLLTACSLSIEEVFDEVTASNGVCIPAHIDRNSYSIVSNLGIFPQQPVFRTVEISPKGTGFPIPPNKLVIRNSDAHYLGDISERENFLEIENLTSEAVITLLQNGL